MPWLTQGSEKTPTDDHQIKHKKHRKDFKMNEQVKEFEELAKPLMEYLHKNFHPHAQIIINWDGAEVVEGKIGVPYTERS